MSSLVSKDLRLTASPSTTFGSSVPLAEYLTLFVARVWVVVDSWGSCLSMTLDLPVVWSVIFS